MTDAYRGPVLHIYPATERYCAGLAKFGLTPTQCLRGVGLRYNAALTRLVAAGMRPGDRRDA